MSMEMNTMMMTMPVMPQGPVAIHLRCFEATTANISTLRSLTKAADGACVTAASLIKSGMKATNLTVSLSTNVKSICADLKRSANTAAVDGDDAHMTLFALARGVAGEAVSDPLISLVDGLTVEELVQCPQMNVLRRGATYSTSTTSPSSFSSTEAGAEEVCVGAAEGEDDATSATTVVIFYARDTALGCGSECCLGACLGALCATICCCCCCSD